MVGVPIKPFAAAKRRLDGVLPPAQRRELARALAANTLATIAATGQEPIVLAADDEVDDFATTAGYHVLVGPGYRLNGAATQFRDHAISADKAWLLIHADLPYLSPASLAGPLAELGEGNAVIAPSLDGGTPLLGGLGAEFVFTYGPASFQRHLRQIPRARVFPDYRLACDIDRPRDLLSARSRTGLVSTLLGS